MTGPKMNFFHIASRLYGKPLLMREMEAEAFEHTLRLHIGTKSLDRLDTAALAAGQLNALAGDATRRHGDDWKLFRLTDGVAVIRIEGALVQKSGWIDPICGMTGYDGITRQFRAAMNDNDVKAIWFDIDSPGGEVSGLFQLAELIASCTESEGGKPVWAWINEQACSAAYALACVCDRVYGPDGCISASIGVCLMHLDATAAYDKAGLKPTMFRSGERKARGGSMEALDKETIAKLTALVNATGARFAELVSMGRNVAASDILALKGDWFAGQDLVDLRLIDGLMSEEEAWERLLSHIGRSH